MAVDDPLEEVEALGETLSGLAFAVAKILGHLEGDSRFIPEEKAGLGRSLGLLPGAAMGLHLVFQQEVAPKLAALRRLLASSSSVTIEES